MGASDSKNDPQRTGVSQINWKSGEIDKTRLKNVCGSNLTDYENPAPSNQTEEKKQTNSDVDHRQDDDLGDCNDVSSSRYGGLTDDDDDVTGELSSRLPSGDTELTPTTSTDISSSRSHSSYSRASYSYEETDTGRRSSAQQSEADGDAGSILIGDADVTAASPTSTDRTITLLPKVCGDTFQPGLTKRHDPGKYQGRRLKGKSDTKSKRKNQPKDMSFGFHSDKQGAGKKKSANQRLVSANVTIVPSSNEVVQEWLYQNNKPGNKNDKVKSDKNGTNGKHVSLRVQSDRPVKKHAQNLTKPRQPRSDHGDYYSRHCIPTLTKLKAEAHWTGDKLKVQIRAPHRVLPPIATAKRNGQFSIEKDLPVEVEIVQTSVPNFSKTTSSKTSKQSSKHHEKLPIWHWKRPPHVPLLKRDHPLFRDQRIFTPSEDSVIRRRALRTPFETRINPPTYRKSTTDYCADMASSDSTELSSRSEYSSDYSTTDDSQSDEEEQAKANDKRSSNIKR